MPRPLNEKRNNTPIMVTKIWKTNLRKFAKPATGRKGYESDAQLLERILSEYEKTHQPENQAGNPTYVGKTPT